MESLYSLFKELILEGISHSQITDAIFKHKVVRIYYDNRGLPNIDEDTETPGYRDIEPYVFGYSPKMKSDTGRYLLLRAYQLEGVTDSESPQWKTFRVDGIKQWTPLKKTFWKPISDRDPNVPKYNENGDKKILNIIAQAKFRSK